jgi:hypothetical protein
MENKRFCVVGMFLDHKVWGGCRVKTLREKEPHPLTTTQPHTVCVCVCVNRAVRTVTGSHLLTEEYIGETQLLCVLINDSICCFVVSDHIWIVRLGIALYTQSMGTGLCL